MSHWDKALWHALSPLFDTALDLEPGPRADLVASLRLEAPELAAALARLLDEHDRALVSGFLDAPFDVNEAATASLAGRTIGAYTLERPLGAGGMGTVWLARRSDGRFEAIVALKLVHLALVDGVGQERFRREGSLLARLAHPNIARLLDAGVTDAGQPFLVLEYVEGLRLDRYAADRTLGLRERLDLFLQVADAVAHAHANLVVHRDLKPSNILVDARGQVKLLDFGIATLIDDRAAGEPGTITLAAARALTPAFAAPEQLTGGQVTTATDVYALGVLLYLLLTDRHPAGEANTSPAALLRAIVDVEPPRLSEVGPKLLAGDLETIVATALKKNPLERYSTVTPFAEDLRRYIRHEPISARADSLAYRAAKFVRRNRTTVALGSVALVALIAGLVGTLTQARRATQQATLAVAERERADQQATRATEQRDFALRQLSRAEAINDLNQFLLSDAAPMGGTFTAGELLERAEHIAERPEADTPENRVEMLVTIGRQYGTLDEDAKARRVLGQAFELSRTSTDHSVRAKAACAYANAIAQAGEAVRARALVQHALNDLPDTPVFVLSRAFCHLRGTEVERQLGEPSAAIAHVQAAQALVKGSGQASALLALRVSMAVAESYRVAGRHHEASAAFADAFASLAALGRDQTETASTLLNNWGLVHYVAGQPIEAERLLRRAIEISRADGTDANVSPMMLTNLARPLLDLARVPEAIDLAERAFAKAARSGNDVVIYQSLLVRARAYREHGELTRAAQMLSEAEPHITRLFPAGNISFAALASERASIALARGDVATAREAADRAIGIAEASPQGREGLPRYLLRRAAIALHAGHTDAAVADATRGLKLQLELSGATVVSNQLGLQFLMLGRALVAAGRSAEARGPLASALQQLEATVGAGHPETRLARSLGEIRDPAARRSRAILP